MACENPRLAPKDKDSPETGEYAWCEHRKHSIGSAAIPQPIRFVVPEGFFYAMTLMNILTTAQDRDALSPFLKHPIFRPFFSVQHVLHVQCTVAGMAA